jgi:hypothetical protein
VKNQRDEWGGVTVVGEQFAHKKWI